MGNEILKITLILINFLLLKCFKHDIIEIYYYGHKSPTPVRNCGKVRSFTGTGGFLMHCNLLYLAAATALSTSALSASCTWAMVSPVAGFNVANVFKREDHSGVKLTAVLRIRIRLKITD